MEPFARLTGVAAPMPHANVDTDTIIPARFLKVTDRSGLGDGLFAGLRYRPDGAEEPDFILNLARYRSAKILIAHENFGCGSSREHACWALLDFGIRCVVAPSFADIFRANCLRNGMLAACLPRDACDLLIADTALDATSAPLTIDLDDQQVVRTGGGVLGFAIPPLHRHILLNGLDEIGLTLEHARAIDRFETRPSYPPLPTGRAFVDRLR